MLKTLISRRGSVWILPCLIPVTDGVRSTVFLEESMTLEDGKDHARQPLAEQVKEVETGGSGGIRSRGVKKATRASGERIPGNSSGKGKADEASKEVPGKCQGLGRGV